MTNDLRSGDERSVVDSSGSDRKSSMEVRALVGVESEPGDMMALMKTGSSAKHGCQA